MTEPEVYNNLVSSRFFETLGYAREGYGVDVRSQQPVRGYEPDYYCLDTFEKTIFVIELKKPSDDEKTPLEEYKDKQLSEKYVNPLRARYGILTNGVKLVLYERGRHRIPLMLIKPCFCEHNFIRAEASADLYRRLLSERIC
jgi:hypothetical protein